MFICNLTLGQAPQPALDPELLCVVHVHLCAGQKALFEDPERLSVETGTYFTRAILLNGLHACHLD